MLFGKTPWLFDVEGPGKVFLEIGDGKEAPWLTTSKMGLTWPNRFG